VYSNTNPVLIFKNNGRQDGDGGPAEVPRLANNLETTVKVISGGIFFARRTRAINVNRRRRTFVFTGSLISRATVFTYRLRQSAFRTFAAAFAEHSLTTALSGSLPLSAATPRQRIAFSGVQRRSLQYYAKRPRRYSSITVAPVYSRTLKSRTRTEFGRNVITADY